MHYFIVYFIYLFIYFDLKTNTQTRKMGGTFSCCQPEIAVNRYIVRPLRQIGEGAYSQVYEVPTFPLF
jgi:hypothetical protein